jgi:hypothetical protein
MAPAEIVCAILKPRLALAGWALRKSHMMASITPNPRLNATRGESSIGRTTFSTTTFQCAVAPAASAAPTRPPMRACEEDDGRP